MTKQNSHDPTQRQPNEGVGVVLPDTAPEVDTPDQVAVGSASVSMTTTSSFAVDKIAPGFSSELPSRLQDRYVFRSLLGLGGFGAVYEAWDEVLQRVVAIKISRRERFDGTSGRQQFLAEARAAAKLKHPHIVTVFDSGSDAEGNPFVVFELIAGESLASRIKRQPLSPHEAISLLATVAEAIHVAHKCGLVHRDLKPANILLDSNGQPHVTDFGLAVDEQTQRDMAGEVAGSPQYMSPEQIRGETQYLDGRTDVWSLGVILYELLAHRRPFSGRDHHELHDEIQHREPKPLRQIDESLTTELEEICLRCLRKNIAERWTSAAELAARLRSSQVTSPNVLTDLLRSNKLQAVAAIVLLTLLTTLAVLAPRFWPVTSSHSMTQSSNQPTSAANPPVSGSVSSPDQTAPQNFPRQPTPGKWFPLLLQKPEILLWPRDGRNTKLDHDPISQELWLTCGESGLLKLGKASGDFEIQMDLHQSPWVGDIGLFLGMQTAEQDGVPVQRYQYIELMCPRDRKGQHAFLCRVQIVRHATGSKAIVSRQTHATTAIPAPVDEDVPLRVTVSGGRLSSVRWNGQQIPELVAETLDSVFPVSAQQGIFGLVLNQSSVVVRRAEFLIPFGEAP